MLHFPQERNFFLDLVDWCLDLVNHLDSTFSVLALGRTGVDHTESTLAKHLTHCVVVEQTLVFLLLPGGTACIWNRGVRSPLSAFASSHDGDRTLGPRIGRRVCSGW